MMKRFLSSFVLLSLALGSVATFLAGSLPAQAAPLNAYIKGSGPTVYWHASNGRRYVFPNNATFQSWQTSSPQTVTTIGDVELYTIPIGGNMTYRPGSRLVKITTDPRVYAIARYGVLRWVTSEQVARTIYGQNWAQMVDDLPDEFFANYTIGAPIYSGSDYNAANEFTSVSTPNDNISTQASVGTGNNQNNQPILPAMWVAMTASREIIPSNDGNRDVTITATLVYPSVPVDQLRIRIYDRDPDGSGLGTLLRTCEGVVSCSQTAALPLQTNTYSRRYVGNITNRFTGQVIADDSSFYVQAQGSGNTTPAETVLPYGPYTCVQGYVWREAIPNDYVCVTPDVRTQAWADNVQAAARVSPTGGAYGPDTCIQGYVWRGARTEDHVCVLPWVRDQTQADNAQANARRVSMQGPTALNPTGVITLALDRSMIDSASTNRTAVFTASVTNNTMPTDQVRIRLVNEATNTIERTCEGTLTCTFTYNAALNAAAATTVYRAELHNRATSVMVATPSRRMLTITRSNGNPTPSNRFSASTSLQGAITERWTHAWGETVEYHADLINPPSDLNGVMIRVYDVGSGLQLWKDCPAMTQCAFTLTSLPRITRTIVARATDGAGTLISSNTVTVTYGTQDGTTTPVVSVSTALDQSQANRCNENFGAVGTITVNMPATVTYKWERSDGAIAPMQTVTFTQAGSKTVSEQWFMPATYSGWLRLHILTPNEVISNQTAIVSQCPVAPAFQVTSVSNALDQNAANRCNEGFGVIGTITANGPGTVSYKWERSDGAIPPVETVTFTQAGSKTVSGSWFLSGNYSGWLRLKIVAPNEVTSNQTAIVSQCQAPTPTLSGSIYTSTDPGEAQPGQMVRVDASLTLNQSTGPVRVEIFNQDGQGIKTCWNMSSSGFCQAYQAMIPSTAQGTYSFYAQAIDGYGNRIQGNWFAVRIR